MASSLAKATELDFAEFASTLISKTLDAVVSSILTQEKTASELEREALSSPEDFARRNLSDDVVRAEVLRLFPHPQGKESKSAVNQGEPYEFPSEKAEETPPIYKSVGYKMEKNDVTKSEGGFVISDNGYKHIFEAVKLELARQQLDALRRTVSRGIPRVYVDHGHITAKLLLRLEEAPETAPPKPSVPPSLKTVSTAFRKVMVQSVNVNKPEFLSLKADVLSEIEITFKTVVP